MDLLEIRLQGDRPVGGSLEDVGAFLLGLRRGCRSLESMLGDEETLVQRGLRVLGFAGEPFPRPLERRQPRELTQRQRRPLLRRSDKGGG